MYYIHLCYINLEFYSLELKISNLLICKVRMSIYGDAHADQYNVIIHNKIQNHKISQHSVIQIWLKYYHSIHLCKVNLMSIILIKSDHWLSRYWLSKFKIYIWSAKWLTCDIKHVCYALYATKLYTVYNNNHRSGIPKDP